MIPIPYRFPMQSPPPDPARLAEARSILRSEAAAINAVADRLDHSILRAIDLIHQKISLDSPGVLVVSGVGKSGLVGQRVSASFASTGTPSHFLHPVEAVHGDLGRVRAHDVVLLLSYGGESDEITRLLNVLKTMTIPVIAVTGKPTSTLGKNADICIAIGSIEEACPLRLAPTTTVNVLSAVADAIVLGVMGKRDFSAEDFAAFHPAGSLGRKLLKVHQAMHFKVGENLSTVSDSLTVRDVLSHDRTAGRRAGAILLVDATGILTGIFTDGDLRRKLEAHANLLDLPIADVMTKNPKTINADALASEALALMNRHRIDELPVIDPTHKPLGLIDVQDMVSLKIVE
jgi:arabinose-5-phosphate isomerase